MTVVLFVWFIPMLCVKDATRCVKDARQGMNAVRALGCCMDMCRSFLVIIRETYRCVARDALVDVRSVKGSFRQLQEGATSVFVADSPMFVSQAPRTLPHIQLR